MTACTTPTAGCCSIATVPVTTEELIPLARAVASSVRRAFVVADLPFGSYEVGGEQALTTAVRFMKETGAHAVKLEGGRRSAAQISRIVEAGIPVMAHIGFTPQSEHRLGGHRVQGRGRPRPVPLRLRHRVPRRRRGRQLPRAGARVPRLTVLCSTSRDVQRTPQSSSQLALFRAMRPGAPSASSRVR